MIVDNGTEKAIALRKKFNCSLTPKFKKDLEANPELIVVFGGDGTLLYKINEFGLDKVYLPINGGSLGFLTNNADDITRTAAMVEAGVYNIEDLMTLTAQINFSEDVLYDTAINDIYIERATGQSARLTIFIDDKLLVKELICDGVIVSSPLGSTGYNKSAGGSICLPGAEVLQVTPICAHHPSLQPIIVPITAEIKVQAEEGIKRPVRVVADGRSHQNINSVVIRVGEQKLQVAYFKGNDFTDRLISKILQG